MCDVFISRSVLKGYQATVRRLDTVMQRILFYDNFRKSQAVPGVICGKLRP
jgi:hypothetical protein